MLYFFYFKPKFHSLYWLLREVLLALYRAERELLPLPSVLLMRAAGCTSPPGEAPHGLPSCRDLEKQKISGGRVCVRHTFFSEISRPCAPYIRLRLRVFFVFFAFDYFDYGFSPKILFTTLLSMDIIRSCCCCCCCCWGGDEAILLFPIHVWTCAACLAVFFSRRLYISHTSHLAKICFLDRIY